MNTFILTYLLTFFSVVRGHHFLRFIKYIDHSPPPSIWEYDSYTRYVSLNEGFLSSLSLFFIEVPSLWVVYDEVGPLVTVVVVTM